MSSDSLALDQDTIAAIATPSGRGGVNIIRVSGPKALPIAELLTHKTVHARQPLLTRFFAEDNGVLDTGLNAFFKAGLIHRRRCCRVPLPRRRDGDQPAARSLSGSRCAFAQAGEFSERAFLNNKMDLTQAEGRPT